MVRKTRRKKASAKARKMRSVPVLWIVTGVLLLGGVGLYALSGLEPTAQAALQYAEEEVAHDRPFRAVHEMRPGPRIPFLPTDQPQPKIVIPDGYYDFGRVGPRSVVKRQFLVRNEGAAPLTISRAYTTCGCTVADFSARVIPPGKAALVTLVFDAGFHDVRGQTVKRGIIIENNDRNNAKAEIWTSASVTWN